MKTTTGMLAVAALLACASRAAYGVPPRVLYNNDGLGGGVLQQRNWGARLGPDAPLDDCLRAAVDETQGLCVHLLAPGDGWVPWWQSRVYPMEEHARWLREQGFTGEEIPGEQSQFVLAGGDMVQVFVDRCREKGIAPYITFRMNDYHWNEFLWLPGHLLRRELFGRNHWPLARISRFLAEHWEHAIGPPSAAFRDAAGDEEEQVAIVLDPRRRWPLRDRGVLDWAEPVVREHKLAFLRELAAYDIDGLELDFMRHCRFFKDDFPVEDRIAIMTGFVREVRRLLDESAPQGRRRRLVARVPSRLVQMPQIGIDLEAFVEAGLDYVNLSAFFMSTHDSDLAEVVRMLPGTPVYLEMSQASKGSADGSSWRPVTPEQLATAAHITYARGGAGLSYFNIQYYRAGRLQNAVGDASPIDIPFEVMRAITDPAAAARMPQHYFIGPGSPPPRTEGARQVPRTLDTERPAVFFMDCAPPEGGWQAAGRLRIESREPWGGRRVMLTINGNVCPPAGEVGEPFPDSFFNPAAAAEPGHLRAWSVAPEMLVDGPNEIRVSMENGEDGAPLQIEFIDLAFQDG